MASAYEKGLDAYSSPQIVDYGTIAELTASTGTPSATDVPMNTPVNGPAPNFGVLGVS